MGEEDLHKQPGNHQENEEFSLKEAAQRAARYVLPASLVAAAVLSASKPNSSPDANRYEQAQKFLDAAAQRLSVEARLSGESKNYVAVGTTIIIEVKPNDPPLTLYHTPFGFSKIKPEKADPDSMADPLVVKPGNALIIRNMRRVTFPNLSKQPDIFIMNLPGTPQSNQATNAAQIVFITERELYKLGAQYYTPGGEQKQELQAEVGSDGNLVIRGEEGSVKVPQHTEIIAIDKLTNYISEHGLEPRKIQLSAGDSDQISNH